MRGRGIDFEHRFNTSRWAEDLLIDALGVKHGLLAKRFGLSEIRAEDQLVYGLTSYKEPDLLVYRLKDLRVEEQRALRETNLETANRADFVEGGDLHFAFTKAIAAIEVEFSPYRAAEMKDRNWKPRSEEMWRRRPLKRAAPPTAPNVIVKEEDLPKLYDWERTSGVPIAVVHLFDQEGFAISLKSLRQFNTVDAQGAREQKTIFRVTPAAAIKAGDLRNVRVSAQLGVSTSKKYVTHAIFSGGRIEVTPQFIEFLSSLREDCDRAAAARGRD